MSKQPDSYPNCPRDCRAAHTLQQAMFLLGVGRTKLYELMDAKKIIFVDTDYGRRIRHDEIDRYLSRTVTNTGEQVRTETRP